MDAHKVAQKRIEGDEMANLKQATKKATRAKSNASVEAWITEQRRLYAVGELSRWQIARLEKIPGWTWNQ